MLSGLNGFGGNTNSLLTAQNALSSLRPTNDALDDARDSNAFNSAAEVWNRLEELRRTIERAHRDGEDLVQQPRLLNADIADLQADLAAHPPATDGDGPSADPRVKLLAQKRATLAELPHRLELTKATAADAAHGRTS